MRSSSSEEEKENPSKLYESAVINALISTLPSLDSQRQYPSRLKPFFDFADVSGNSLGEKADHLYSKLKITPPS
jgi:hypothetical protein